VKGPYSRPINRELVEAVVLAQRLRHAWSWVVFALQYRHEPRVIARSLAYQRKLGRSFGWRA
jgi:hypothetical protein